MANSITLSQSLIDDIAQKIADGTATAEQVVLYTKGLNQLQTGNDFQSVTIGLSQSAVDAIDSANAQFQEDATTALATFSQTAENIDTGATNAISAMNTAKDTLIATDAELSVTVNGLPSRLNIEESVRMVRGTDSRTKAPFGWDGPHQLGTKFTPYNPGYPTFEIDHAWKAPNFIVHSRQGDTTHDSVIYLMDHELNIIDEVGVEYTEMNCGTTSYIGRRHNVTGLYNYLWKQHHNYFVISNEEHPASTDRNNYTMTGGTNMFGHQRHIHSPFAYEGLKPGSFGVSTNQTGSNDRGVYGGTTFCLVGTSKRDWVMARPYNERWVRLSAAQLGNYAMYSRNERDRRKNGTYGWNLTHQTVDPLKNPFGKYGESKISGDTFFHTQFDFPSSGAGMGLISYNANTNKFAYINTESDGTAYKWTPKLYSVNAGNDLRDIALGRQEVPFNTEPVSGGIMTLEIDSSLDFKTESQSDQTTTDYSTFDRYSGSVCLCDNDTMIISTPYDNGAAQRGHAYRRIVKNASGTGYEYDTMKWWDTNTGITSADYGAMATVTSNDGKYVIMFGSYYYQGSGFNAVLIRVSDGSMLPFRNADTSRGFTFIPNKHNGFIIKRNYTSDSTSMWYMDCDYLFEQETDMTDISARVFATADHREYIYAHGFKDRLKNIGTTNFSLMPIYSPYTYMHDYIDKDGSLKDQYSDYNNLDF